MEMRRYFLKEKGKEEIEISSEEWIKRMKMEGVADTCINFQTLSCRGRSEDYGYDYAIGDNPEAYYQFL